MIKQFIGLFLFNQEVSMCQKGILILRILMLTKILKIPKILLTEGSAHHIRATSEQKLINRNTSHNKTCVFARRSVHTCLYVGLYIHRLAHIQYESMQYEKSSDKFDIGHCQIKVKVTVQL